MRTIKQKYALRMEVKDNIFGCFFKVKVGFDPNLSEQDFAKIADTFKAYIWNDSKSRRTCSYLARK